MAAEQTLEVTQLSCNRQQRLLFTDLSFHLKSGEALWIKGANGSGKSSLLRLLTGLATPIGGEIKWCDQRIQALGADYGQALHYVAHQDGIKSGLTVAENLQLSARLSSSMANGLSILSSLQLSAYQHTLAQDLSAGQKRRLSLAKLILFPKPLWILDEPFTALDSATEQFFMAELAAHLKKGGIAVMSSHHPLHLDEAPLNTLSLTPC